MIEKTKEFFLAERLIKSTDLEVIEYDEANAEYKLRFMFRQSLIAGKLRGMQVVKPPLKLYFDARLRFNAEKQIQIVFEKYEEETFSMVKEGQVLDNQTPISESPKLQELHSAALAANPTFLVKALTWANGGIDAVKDMTKNRPEFRKKLNSSFDVYEDLVESGNAKWLTDE